MGRVASCEFIEDRLLGQLRVVASQNEGDQPIIGAVG